MQTIKLKIDFECPGCITTITQCLQDNSDNSGVIVEQCGVNATRKIFTILTSGEYSGDLTAYFINKLGKWDFSAKPWLSSDSSEVIPSTSQSAPPTPAIADTIAPPVSQSSPEPTVFSSRTTHLLQGGLGLGFGIVMASLLFFNIAMPIFILYILAAASTLMTLWLGWNTYTKAAIQLLKARTLTMDSLFTISSLAAVTISLVALYNPALPMMFDAGLMIFGMKHLGEAIKNRLNTRLIHHLSFQNLAPSTVTKISEQQEMPCNISDLKIGDFIKLQPGEYLPVDASLEDSKGQFITAVHTGNLNRQTFYQSSLLKAGTQIADTGPLIFKVEKTMADSELARLDQLLDSPNNHQSKIEITSRDSLHYFIGGIILLAGISGAIATATISATMGIYTALSLLTAACPCTMGYLVSMTFDMGMKKARELGVEFKGTSFIEKAGTINKVVFDLNGTLTNGNPEIKNCEFINSSQNAEAEIAAAVYALEAKSNHSFAKAIQTYFKPKTVNIPEISCLKLFHNGIQGTVADATYTIGNYALMKSENQLTHLTQFKEPPCHPHVIYIAKNHELVARIQMDDALRPGATELITTMKQAGKTVYLCTGATKSTANGFAKILGISDQYVKADCSTDEKLKFIQALQDEHHQVAMIGDATNDAIPIAKSDLGIAVASSHQLTKDQAHVAINENSLQSIFTTFMMGKKTMTSIRQIIGWSITYNLCALAITALVLPSLGIMVPPGLCYGLMVFQSILLSRIPLRLYQCAIPTIISKSTISIKPSNGTCSNTIMLQNGLTLTPNVAKTDVQTANALPTSHLQTITNFFGIAKTETITEYPKTTHSFTLG